MNYHLSPRMRHNAPFKLMAYPDDDAADEWSSITRGSRHNHIQFVASYNFRMKWASNLPNTCK